MRTFEEFKAEILTRAKAASACTDQYKRAYAASDCAELFAVIKDNFFWCCNNKVIDAEMIKSVREDAARCDVWCNVDVTSGFALATDTATVEAYGSATVRATGSATVRATDSATVEATDSATVWATDSATVEATDSATVWATDSATVEATDSATVWATDSATVRATDTATVRAYGSATVWATGSATVWAYDTATVEAYGSATVEAYGSAYINVRSDMECKISDRAIMRYRDTDEIMIVAGSLKIKEIEVTE